MADDAASPEATRAPSLTYQPAVRYRDPIDGREYMPVPGTLQTPSPTVPFSVDPTDSYGLRSSSSDFCFPADFRNRNARSVEPLLPECEACSGSYRCIRAIVASGGTAK